MKKLGQLKDEKLTEYLNSNPNEMDLKIRKWFNIPENKYFTVTTFPSNMCGVIWLDESRHRVVETKKISKSDQQ